MDWKLKTINQRVVPAKEGEQTYDTAAKFESAVRAALLDHWTKVVSGTLADGSVLDETELRRRYR